MSSASGVTTKSKRHTLTRSPPATTLSPAVRWRGLGRGLLFPFWLDGFWLFPSWLYRQSATVARPGVRYSTPSINARICGTSATSSRPKQKHVAASSYRVGHSIR